MDKSISAENKKGRDILFLGAGASHDAGYPLTNNFFHELRIFCQRSIEKSHLQTWKSFETTTKKLCRILQINFEKQNPEIILTLPDLVNSSEDDLLTIADKEYSQGDKESLNEYTKIQKTKIWSDAATVQRQLNLLIEEYFISKNIEIYNNSLSGKLLPEYLYKMLDCANTVITTNWDALAEFALYKLNKWFPSDGYGFKRTLKESDTHLRPGETINFPQSESKILKLHGSIGWHYPNEKFYLRYDNFLQFIINKDIHDIDDPKLLGRHENSIMLYPSYLKQLENPILISVWEEARKALETASSITIVGYSLPQAHAAIRALLLPARTNAATIKIVSPSTAKSDEHKRWTAYFKHSGKNIDFVIKKAADYFK